MHTCAKMMFVMNAVVLLCLMKQNHWALKLNSSAYRIWIPIYQYCDGARYPNAMLMGYIITCSVVLTHSVHDGQVTIWSPRNCWKHISNLYAYLWLTRPFLECDYQCVIDLSLSDHFKKWRSFLDVLKVIEKKKQMMALSSVEQHPRSQNIQAWN